MNAGDFLDRIRDDNETALSRLGSSKALYALTDGEMEGDAVLTAAADGAHAAAETLEDWADESAADAFTSERVVASAHGLASSYAREGALKYLDDISTFVDTPRAVYERTEEGITKYVEWGTDDAAVRVDGVGDTTVLPGGGKERVRDVFETLTDRGVNTRKERDEIDSDTLDALEDLGYV